MDRCCKAIIVSLLISFIMVNEVFAYEIYDFNLQEYRNLINKNQIVYVKAVDDDQNTVKYDVIDKECLNDFIPKASVVKKDELEEDDKKAVMNLNDEQLYLLSKLVAAEARGESYQGQVAVAAVVLNRVKDDRFPDSIEGVIYQKNAFSVVKDGYINMIPTEESYKAAKDALYGNDPTNQAIYFWNPDISTCKWINTLNPHMRIGNHVFAK